MKYNEVYCTDLLQKVINDLDEWRGYESYYDKEVPFKAYHKRDEKNYYTNEIVKNSWLVYVEVLKDGWKAGFIIIHIDDDTGKALTYVNSALGGRSITFPLEINEEGKYFIPSYALPE